MLKTLEDILTVRQQFIDELVARTQTPPKERVRDTDDIINEKRIMLKRATAARDAMDRAWKHAQKRFTDEIARRERAVATLTEDLKAFDATKGVKSKTTPRKRPATRKKPRTKR